MTNKKNMFLVGVCCIAMLSGCGTSFNSLSKEAKEKYEAGYVKESISLYEEALEIKQTEEVQVEYEAAKLEAEAIEIILGMNEAIDAAEREVCYCLDGRELLMVLAPLKTYCDRLDTFDTNGNETEVFDYIDTVKTNYHFRSLQSEYLATGEIPTEYTWLHTQTISVMSIGIEACLKSIQAVEIPERCFVENPVEVDTQNSERVSEWNGYIDGVLDENNNLSVRDNNYNIPYRIIEDKRNFCVNPNDQYDNLEYKFLFDIYGGKNDYAILRLYLPESDSPVHNMTVSDEDRSITFNSNKFIYNDEYGAILDLKIVGEGCPLLMNKGVYPTEDEYKLFKDIVCNGKNVKITFDGVNGQRTEVMDQTFQAATADMISICEQCESLFK